jgi:hypothetical protein
LATESDEHRSLKVEACRWLFARGAAVCAPEVTCPIPRYRADAAGWFRGEEGLAGAGAHGVGARGEGTEIVEVKVSRSDFLRDGERAAALIAKRATLLTELARVDEEFTRVCEPWLRRRGELLFEEMEPWDFSASASLARRALVEGVARLEVKLHRNTKFFALARYKMATRLWLLTPAGMVSPGETPPGWGLLELGRDGKIGVVVEGARHATRAERDERFVRAMGVSLTRARFGGAFEAGAEAVGAARGRAGVGARTTRA